MTGTGVGGEGGSGGGGGGVVTVPVTPAAGGSSVIDAAAPGAGPDAQPGPCVGLQCQQVACPGATTTVSGTVFAPNGKLPLYNVVVYVPNAPLDPVPAGVRCDRCGAVQSGKPVVTGLTDAEGKFKLNNVPAGTDIPLVMQVGKWRRKVTLAKVIACQDNPITDANLTRLPRNRKEGDMPSVAITTGSCDQLGCLLPKLGIDPAEFGVAGDDKAIIYYNAVGGVVGGPVGTVGTFGPPNMRPSTDLWDSEAALSKYDVTLLSCECGENLNNKSMASFTAMTNYLAKGGRIFGSHFSYVWLNHSTDPDLKAAIGFESTKGLGKPPMTIDTTFPKGKAMADWMKFVDPAITYGEIDSRQVFDNIASVTPPTATSWATSATTGGAGGNSPRIITVNTPAGAPADKQCGRAAHLDAHITVDNEAGPMMPRAGGTFPASCAGNLTNGETALAFLFFDLSSCIQDDTKPVVPPIVIP
ncbi:MAG TPA: carboxypeptidase regulatory-like domain-containing protein [Polyangia bacterium]|nr:carboxypeptidase regulatory-like domain-containing protein [Polyangia bacterium]